MRVGLRAYGPAFGARVDWAGCQVDEYNRNYCVVALWDTGDVRATFVTDPKGLKP